MSIGRPWQAIRSRDVVLPTVHNYPWPLAYSFAYVDHDVLLQRKRHKKYFLHHRNKPEGGNARKGEGGERNDWHWQIYKWGLISRSIDDIPSIWDIAAAHFSITSNGNDAFFVLTSRNPHHTTPQTPPFQPSQFTTTNHHRYTSLKPTFPFSYMTFSSFRTRGIVSFFPRFLKRTRFELMLARATVITNLEIH